MSDKHDEPSPRCDDGLQRQPPELAEAIREFRELYAVPDDERESAWHARKDALQRRGNELLAPYFDARILKLQARLSRLADGALEFFERYSPGERLTDDTRMVLASLVTDGLTVWRELVSPLEVPGGNAETQVSEFLKLASKPRPPIFDALEKLNKALANLRGGVQQSRGEQIPKYAQAVLKYVSADFVGGKVVPSKVEGGGIKSDGGVGRNGNSAADDALPALTDEHRECLEQLRLMQASENRPQKQKDVAPLIDKFMDETHLKERMAYLSRLGYVRGKPSRAGGNWPTPEGLERLKYEKASGWKPKRRKKLN